LVKPLNFKKTFLAPAPADGQVAKWRVRLMADYGCRRKGCRRCRSATAPQNRRGLAGIWGLKACQGNLLKFIVSVRAAGKLN